MADLQIEYYRNGRYEISGNVKEAEVPELINTFLMGQRGKGEDKGKPNIKDKYTILIEVDLSYDIFNVKDDAGNKGLRDGILMDVFTKEEERLGLESKIRFQEHLDKASERVRKWPIWKQTIFGRSLPEHRTCGGVKNG